MQQTIGERLQQARQRMGLSLDEVAEKIKIRKDILFKFESNEFSTRLPQIYSRGFFISYVKFLKLNDVTFLAEYEAIMGPAERSITLGHLQIEPHEEKIEDEPQMEELNPDEGGSAKFVKPIFQFIYFKWLILLVVGCFLGLVIYCFWPKKVDEFPAIAEPVENIFEEKAEKILSEEITLVALDTVQVFVRQESDKRRLFSGTLNKGERQIVSKEDVLQISYSEGNNLRIERSDGTAIHPQKAGRGWIRIL